MSLFLQLSLWAQMTFSDGYIFSGQCVTVTSCDSDNQCKLICFSVSRWHLAYLCLPPQAGQISDRRVYLQRLSDAKPQWTLHLWGFHERVCDSFFVSKIYITSITTETQFAIATSWQYTAKLQSTCIFSLFFFFVKSLQNHAIQLSSARDIHLKKECSKLNPYFAIMNRFDW